MLKVKQSFNPEFEFLKPESEYHAYYVWLKQQHEERTKEKESVDKAGGMDLLNMYSSSSDEDESTAGKEKSTQLQPCVDTRTDSWKVPSEAVSVPTGAHEKRRSEAVDDDAAKKARRLKRAKQMRGHYRLQLMEDSKPD